MLLPTYLAAIPDHRRSQGRLYGLEYLLLFSILAILSNATSYRKIQRFIEARLPRLNALCGPHWKRAPAHTAIRYALQGLDPADVESAFRGHAAVLAGSPADRTPIALDGKTLRGSFDRFQDQKAVQILSALSTDRTLILGQASWKDRKPLTQALKPIYQADSAETAEQALSAFENGPWGERFPTVAQSWRRHWPQVIPFFAFSAPVRQIIYTTNAIESLHSGVRKSIRNKGHFPNDEAATKLIWLALRNLTAKWTNPPLAWAAAKAQFAIQFGERFTPND